jgi:hypothetical protein
MVHATGIKASQHVLIQSSVTRTVARLLRNLPHRFYQTQVSLEHFFFSFLITSSSTAPAIPADDLRRGSQQRSCWYVMTPGSARGNHSSMASLTATAVQVLGTVLIENTRRSPESRQSMILKYVSQRPSHWAGLATRDGSAT